MRAPAAFWPPAFCRAGRTQLTSTPAHLSSFFIFPSLVAGVHPMHARSPVLIFFVSHDGGAPHKSPPKIFNFFYCHLIEAAQILFSLSALPTNHLGLPQA